MLVCVRMIVFLYAGKREKNFSDRVNYSRIASSDIMYLRTCNNFNGTTFYTVRPGPFLDHRN